MTANKAGPWSKEDKEYIRLNSKSKTPKEIAKKLHRNEDSVIAYMERNGLLTVEQKLQASDALEYDLKKTPHWRLIKEEFTDVEQNLIVHHWNNIVQQFRDDVVHTEEIQILDLCRMEVFMHRASVEKQKSNLKIQEFERDLKTEKDTPGGGDDARIMMLERQIAAFQTASEGLGKEWREINKAKQEILNKLKATREQRIKDIESSKETLAGWLKNMMQRKDLRVELGNWMERFRLATQLEYKRLSEYHAFADGGIDQPLLTAENVILDEKRKESNESVNNGS